MRTYPDVPLPGVPADRLRWLTGRWIGVEDNVRIEEIWSPPEAGSLMGSFRWFDGGEPRFFEFLLVKPGPSGLELHIKHFGPDLVGWEEKDASTAFDLVQVGEREAVFYPRAEGSSGWAIYRIAADDWLEFETVSEEDDSGSDLLLRFAPAPLEQGEVVESRRADRG